MIPLFRNRVPKPEQFIHFLEDSYSSGMMSNFGPLYNECVELLKNKLGGYWLPVTNGTVAIEVALNVGLFRHEKRVAIPDFTFAASANAVLRTGKTPVIFPCDYESRTFNMEALYNNLDSFDAMMVVGAFGYSHRADELQEFAKKYGKGIVFDYAGAFPLYQEDSVCAYSLHTAKSCPIGEGGLVRFGERLKYNIAKRIINFDFDESKSAVTSDGMNGKLDEIRCAILKYNLLNIEKITEETIHKADVLESYQEALKEYCDPISREELLEPSMVVMRGLDCDKIIALGNERGIVFRKYYAPLLSEQAGFIKYSKMGKSDNRIKSHLAVPAHVNELEFHKVIKCIQEAMR